MTTEYFGPPYLDSVFEWLGIPVFDRVVQLELTGSAVDDSVANIAGELSCLRAIELFNTSITDQWLKRFQGQNPDCKVISNGSSIAESAG